MSCTIQAAEDNSSLGASRSRPRVSEPTALLWLDQNEAALDFLVVTVTGFSLLAVATSVTAAVTGRGRADPKPEA